MSGAGPPPAPTEAPPGLQAVLEHAERLRAEEDTAAAHDREATALYAEAQRIAQRVVAKPARPPVDWDRAIDRVVTSPIWGIPIMLSMLAVVFWLTIAGANVPSKMLADAFFWVEAQLAVGFAAVGAPAWVTGLLVHGVYRGLAWVVSVMLPPMAIFFPAFTLLEDIGFLPRVAMNLDRLFHRAGAHGKQALTMSMGFGCNAAGVIACRIIDSPRERLIAIITNNFVPCNGRFPTLIMLATIFIGAVAPPGFRSLAAMAGVVGVVVLGVAATLIASFALSRTVLKGESSSYILELPPYRKPQVLRVLYTSLIDRTMFVLYRAIVMAAPAGAICWLLGNISLGNATLITHVAGWLNPFGHALGLDGVILLAYIIAIPANEIVIPTILMAYTNSGQMTDLAGDSLVNVLVTQQHWTLLTAVCLMLFSLLHYPCSTTIWTIFKETRSVKWTTLAALGPLAVAFVVCFTVATVWRLIAG